MAFPYPTSASTFPFFAYPGAPGTNVIGSYPATGSGQYLNFDLPGGGSHVGGSSFLTPTPDAPLENYPYMLPGYNPRVSAAIVQSGSTPDTWNTNPVNNPGTQTQGLPSNWLTLGASDRSVGDPASAAPKDPNSGLLNFGQFNKLFGSQPLTWTDVHTPLPTFTPYPDYISPTYTPPYTSQMLARQAAANRGALNSLSKYQGDIDKYRAMVRALPDLEPKAHARAVRDIGILKRDIVDQQHQLVQQGQINQRALMAAGQAGTQLQLQVGKDVRQGIASTAQALGTLAGGVTGGLRDATASDLAHIAGALPSGSVLSREITGGIPTTSFGQNAAAGLNQIAGTIPATGLGLQAGLAQQVADQSAQSLYGGGRQAGLLALAGGEQAARALEPQITAADRSIPTLTSQYLDTLTAQRQKNLDQQLTLLVQSGQLSVQKAKQISDSVDKIITEQATNTQGRNVFSVSDASAHNAYNVGSVNAKNQFAQSIATIQGSDIRANASGQLSVLSANQTARRQTIAAYLTYQNNALKAAGKGGLTAYQINNSASKLDDYLTTAWAGKTSQSTSTVAGQPKSYTTVKQQPVPIEEAWRHIQTKFPGLVAALGADYVAGLVAANYHVPWWTTDQVAQGEGPINSLPGNDDPEKWVAPGDQPRYPSTVFETPIVGATPEAKKAAKEAAKG